MGENRFILCLDLQKNSLHFNRKNFAFFAENVVSISCFAKCAKVHPSIELIPLRQEKIDIFAPYEKTFNNQIDVDRLQEKPSIPGPVFHFRQNLVYLAVYYADTSYEFSVTNASYTVSLVCAPLSPRKILDPPLNY